MKKKKTRSRLIFTIVLCIILALIIADWVLSVVIYNENFNIRFESYEPLMLYMDDFEGLERTRYEFPSDKGQMLTGYMYSSGTDQKGIIILAHGFGGGGHNSYMNVADYFAKNGYYVFAYDATGNDESEGKGVGGLPQGTIDLEHAISFVENSGNFPSLPIGLWGHSWGGYSVCTVLTYHPEVKAVIECSGFSRSSDMFEIEGKRQAGYGIYAMLPFVKLHEQIKFGKYAVNTAMDGFAASTAPVMIVHSTDDSVVPVSYGYDLYYEKYKDDLRFVFVRYEDKGHNYIFNDLNYIHEFNADYDKWRDALDYDFKAEENTERYQTERAEYFHEHLDREKWSHCLDEDMFAGFLHFYDLNMAQ